MSGVGQGSAKIRQAGGGLAIEEGLFEQRDWQEAVLGNLRFHQHFLVLLPPALSGNLLITII